MQSYSDKKMNESLSRDMSISYSCEKKRGIFVYTPSKEKDKKGTAGDNLRANTRNSISILRDTIEIEMIKT